MSRYCLINWNPFVDTVVLLRSGNKLSPKKSSVGQQPTVH